MHSLGDCNKWSNRTIEFVFGFEATIATQFCMQIHNLYYRMNTIRAFICDSEWFQCAHNTISLSSVCSSKQQQYQSTIKTKRRRRSKRRSKRWWYVMFDVFTICEQRKWIEHVNDNIYFRNIAPINEFIPLIWMRMRRTQEKEFFYYNSMTRCLVQLCTRCDVFFSLLFRALFFIYKWIDVI